MVGFRLPPPSSLLLSYHGLSLGEPQNGVPPIRMQARCQSRLLHDSLHGIAGQSGTTATSGSSGLMFEVWSPACPISTRAATLPECCFLAGSCVPPLPLFIPQFDTTRERCDRDCLCRLRSKSPEIRRTCQSGYQRCTVENGGQSVRRSLDSVTLEDEMSSSDV